MKCSVKATDFWCIYYSSEKNMSNKNAFQILLFSLVCEVLILLDILVNVTGFSPKSGKYIMAPLFVAKPFSS